MPIPNLAINIIRFLVSTYKLKTKHMFIVNLENILE